MGTMNHCDYYKKAGDPSYPFILIPTILNFPSRSPSLSAGTYCNGKDNGTKRERERERWVKDGKEDWKINTARNARIIKEDA